VIRGLILVVGQVGDQVAAGAHNREVPPAATVVLLRDEVVGTLALLLLQLDGVGLVAPLVEGARHQGRAVLQVDVEGPLALGVGIVAIADEVADGPGTDRLAVHELLARSRGGEGNGGQSGGGEDGGELHFCW